MRFCGFFNLYNGILWVFFKTFGRIIMKIRSFSVVVFVSQSVSQGDLRETESEISVVSGLLQS